VETLPLFHVTLTTKFSLKKYSSRIALIILSKYVYTKLILTLRSATTSKTLPMSGPSASNFLDVCGAVVATCVGNALKRQIQNLGRAAAIVL
jgi:hypothetical protein